MSQWLTRAFVAAMVASVGVATRSRAVDVTGAWAVTGSCIFTPRVAGTLVAADDRFTLDFSQSVGIPCVFSGTIDATSGTLEGTGCDFGGFEATLTGTATDGCLTGAFAPGLDSCTFDGVRACSACDDGNACTTDGCGEGGCEGSAACTYVPAPAEIACDDGTVCTTGDACVDMVCVGVTVGCDDGNPCTTDACDPVLGCRSTPEVGKPCGDGNVCTVDDACDATGSCASGMPMHCAVCEVCRPESGCRIGPRPGCRVSRTPARARLVLEKHDPTSKDRLVWKWRAGEATTVPDFGDPRLDDDYTLCIFEDADSVSPGLLLTATAPAGGLCAGRAGEAPCWSGVGAPSPRDGYRYRDRRLRLPDGIARVRLAPGVDGRAKVVVRGKGSNLRLPSALGLTLPVRVQLQTEVGACWETTHGTARTNREDLFRASGED